jgi:hypothetical protein
MDRPTLTLLDRGARREVTKVVPVDSVGERSLFRGAAFLLVSSALSYALVRCLPRLGFLARPASSIISYGSLHGHAPVENLAFYALALALAALTGAFLLRPGEPDAGSPAPLPDWPRAALVLTVAMLATVAVNASWFDPAARMADTFHEGEMLAYGPSVRTVAGLAGALIIHGPGIDLAPNLLASWLNPGSAIATTRTLHMLEGMLFWLGFCWGLLELLATGEGARVPRWLRIPLLLLCAVPLGATGFTGEMSRKTVLVLQFALIARGLRTGPRFWLAALLGASVPAGLFYNYLEGLAGAGLVAAGAALWWVRGARRAAGIAGLIALAGCAAVVALARPSCQAAFDQVLYWARNGQLIWGLPLRRNPALILIALFGPLVALHAAAGLRLWRARRLQGSWRAAAIGEATLVLVLLLSLACARSWIDRADDLHLELAGWMTVPLLLVLLGPFLARAAASRGARLAAASFVVALPLVGVVGLPVANPALAASRILRVPSASSTPDAAVVGASYAQATRMLAAELGPADCFWTLTSEGVWYELLDRPSCTRFHQVVYARSAEAQAEVLRDLDRTRPPILLFGNADWWNRVDGIPVAVTNPAIERYVLSRYRPWRRVGEHWFWKRAEVELKDGADGCVDGSVAGSVVAQPGVAQISGTLDDPTRVVYVEAADRSLVAAQQVAGDRGEWTVEVPADALPAATVKVYDSDLDALLPLCSAGGEIVGREPR